jgi:hypothetical protein
MNVMSKQKPATHYTLLTATVAGLMSGQALAESAGHISFVYGPVTATSHDGQTRTLHRGDEINGGERITTNSGRVQIRFTDGGFVALTPNTVFGVDQYVYANKKPEDSSLFFNLVRGGMRTITGVIGHINKASYRVKTPVATIGIRGTEYVAEYDGETLQVSVGLGSVAVTNEQGNITLVSGQSAFVTPNAAPQQTNDTPGVGAPGPSGSGSSDSSSGDSSSSTPAPTAGNQQQTGGLPNGVVQPVVSNAVGPLQSTVNGLPLYSFSIAGLASTICDGSCFYTHPVEIDAAALFDSSGDLLQAKGTSTVFDNTGASHALVYANVVNEPGLSFGEVTGVDASSTSVNGLVTATAGQFVPYIVGVSGPAPAPVGTVSFNLAAAGDASTPRLYTTVGNNPQTLSGQLTAFDIDFNLTSRTADLNLQLNMDKAGGGTDNYTVSGSNLSVPDIVQNGTFMLSSQGDGLSVTGSACTNNCSAIVGGFFAGSTGARLGASYDISTTSGDILGVAGLSQNGPVTTASTAPLNGSGTYTFGVPIAGAANNTVLTGALSATFDQSGATAGALRSLTDGAGKLIFANSPQNQTPLSYNGLVTLGSLSYGEVTSFNSTTDGSGTLSAGSISSGSGGNSNTLTITPGIFVPYIVGSTGTLLPTLGIVHYSLLGGSAPRGDLQLAGVLNHFTIDLDLTSQEMSLDLGLTLNGASYDVAAANKTVSSISGGTFVLNGLTTTGANCTTQACTTNIDGFLSGNGGTELGATYAINVGSLDSISGVAALGQTTVSTAVTYQSAYGQDNRTGIDTYYDGHGLLDASSGSAILLSRADETGTAVADSGSDGTLNWGRWVAGNPLVSGSATSSSLTTTDSLHYVSGAQTPGVIMSALNAQGGTVNYALEAATHPTDGSNVGTLNSGSLVVHFGGAPTMDVDLQVGINNKNYGVTGTGNLSSSSPAISISSLTTTGCSSASGCSSSVSGFFAGQQASKIGLGYAINDSGTVTHGAAAFSR